MTGEIPANRFTKIYLSLWGICLLVGLAALIFYKLGYRFTGELSPVKVGSIELSSNETGLQIFLNNRPQNAKLNKDRYSLPNLTPGLHSVVVSKDGFWPWTKTVAVTDNTVRSLYAFIFPMEGIVTKTLASNSAEYKDADKSLKQSILPEPKPNAPAFANDESLSAWLDKYVPSRKLSADKTTALYVEDGTIYVAWISDTEPPPHYFCEENPCQPTMPVIVPLLPVKSVDFYKNRNDVILFTSGSVIYAIEVDREGTQNFQPVYKGIDPYFYETSSGILYIKDGGSIFSSNL